MDMDDFQRDGDDINDDIGSNSKRSTIWVGGDFFYDYDYDYDPPPMEFACKYFYLLSPGTLDGMVLMDLFDRSVLVMGLGLGGGVRHTK